MLGKELKILLENIREKSKELSILYVEDEQELRQQMETFLGKVFINLESAVDGKDGLDKYLKGHHDIVITDIQMPKMNGVELIKKIKEENKEQEIILISAYTESDYLDEAVRFGVSSYIIKPGDFGEILTVLQKSVDKVSSLHKNNN